MNTHSLSEPSTRNLKHCLRSLIVLLNIVALLICTTGQVAAQTKVTYFHNDLSGNPVAASDNTGQITWRESYRPYGERLKNEAASQSNSQWYTGHRQDADTGLVYMGARHYDPLIGRFLSIDPAGFSGSNPHSFNRYAYANNNPLKFIDPDGRLSVHIWEYRGSTEAWGHASITLENGTHISWWPSSDRKSPIEGVPIYSAKPNDNQTYLKDVALEGQSPDRTIRIMGLDEKAIQKWWDAYRDPKSGNEWSTFGPNCSTVAADALKAGGANEYASWWSSRNSFWTPENVKTFSESINKGLEKQNATKNESTK
jgi:RHS repeat-associated protein